MLLFPKENINDKNYLKICPSGELLDRKGRLVKFDDSDYIYEVAIFKVDGKLYCVNNHCPHQNAPEICNGIVKGTFVTCPLHGWTYNLVDGSNAQPNRGLKRLSNFDIIEHNGWIYIEIPNIPIPKWRR